MRKTTRAKTQRHTEPEHRAQYVYGIIRHTGPLSVGLIGIGQERSAVTLIRYRDLAAVVSATPLSVLEPTRENVLAHEAVNQRVIRSHTLVPMSFGTIFKSRGDVSQLLRSAYQTFSEALDTIADNVELGLEVLWDLEQEKGRIEKQTKAVRDRRQAIATGASDGFAARMEYGRLMDAALNQRADEYVAKILAGLRTVSIASKLSPASSARMILKAAFLVERDQKTAFERQLSAIDTRHPNLTFRLTGPWPPYHFVSIRLQIAGEEGAQ